MRVGHVLGTLGRGGAERLVVDLVNHSEDRFSHFIYCLKAGGPLEAEMRPERGRVRLLGGREGADPALAPRLARALRRDGVELLHTHNWGTYVDGGLAGRLAGVPARLHTVHGMYEADTFRVARRRAILLRAFAASYQRITAVSEDVKRRYVAEAGIPADRIEVVPSGADLSRYGPRADRAALRERWGVGPQEWLCVSVGTLYWVKDHATLVEAAGRLRARGRRARFLVVGDGPLREDLERRVAALGLAETFRLAGRIPDPAEALAAADAYALPSRMEGVSVSLLEAMATGLPVVATAVGGTPEVVTDGAHGRLVPPGDPDRLADALEALAADRESGRRMGEAGRAAVRDRFALDRWVERVETIYDRLAGATPAVRRA